MKNKTGGNKTACNEAAVSNGDGLSKLPNDILLNILERVDTLDAIRTCILSKQMMKLPTMLSQLFISVGSIFRTRKFSLSDVIRISSAVAHITENIVNARRQEITIRKLTIRFVLRHDDCVSIGKSVAHVMATQKVEAVEFEIVTEKGFQNCTPDDLLHFARQFNVFLGSCPDAFAGLTRLWLHNMKFGEPDIPIILDTCKRLISLRLSHCDSGTHTVLQVEHAQLVEIEIDYGKFETVELTFVPKLQRVSYNRWCSYGDPIHFGFVPQLSKLSLTKSAIRSDRVVELSQLLTNVPSISNLHLDFQSEKIWVLPECPQLLMPVLSNLQYVNLDNLPEGCDIAWTMFILEAAPSLKGLCITVWDHLCIMVTDKEFRKANGYCDKIDVNWKTSASDFKHKNLAKLTIYGFQPDDNFVQYVKRVAEVAVNMEEISLHDRKVCRRCGSSKIKVCPSRYPRTAEERKQTTERLALASVASIQFWS